MTANAFDLVVALRKLAEETESAGHDPYLDSEVPGMRVQMLGTAHALRMAVAEVERLTVERDRARDLAVGLEQQTAEALRVVGGLITALELASRTQLDPSAGELALAVGIIRSQNERELADDLRNIQRLLSSAGVLDGDEQRQ